MRPGEYFTWNRYLHVATVDGALPTDELLSRTLSLTYFDRIRDFDSIEWTLDNRDGLLTRPEYVAAGLVVRLKIGYIDGGFPWKAFIINRLQGGLGVHGRERPAIGDNESKITYYGRNRNAPGGRSARPWRRTAMAPPKKPRKQFPATKDITVHEMLLDQTDKPRLVKAETTADAVAKIAERNGFDTNYALIEPTDDHIEQVQLKEGQSDGNFLAELAAAWDREFKLDGDVLRWHSHTWDGAKREVCDSLHYGYGEDITKLTVDCDFRLPVPGRIKGVGYDYRLRALHVSDLERADTERQVATAYADVLKDPSRFKALTRYEVVPVTADSLPMADKKTIKAFIRRHMRAFQLVIETVGNPKLLAGKLLDVDGVGSPFADGRWLIAEAMHKVDETTYVTEVKLKPPSKAQGKGRIVAGHVDNLERNKGAVNLRTGYWERLPGKIPSGVRER